MSQRRERNRLSDRALDLIMLDLFWGSERIDASADGCLAVAALEFPESDAHRAEPDAEEPA